MVERVDDEDASEQEVGRLAAGIVDLNELIGPADCALAVLGLLLALLRILHGERREWQEGHAAEVLALEEGDGCLSRLRVLRHDVLLVAAQGDLDGRHVGLRDRQELRDGARDALMPGLLALQHGLRRLAEALVFLLHVLQEVDLLLQAARALHALLLLFAERRLLCLRLLLRMARGLLRLDGCLKLAFLLGERGRHLRLLHAQGGLLPLCRGDGRLALRLPLAARFDIAVEDGERLLGRGELLLLRLALLAGCFGSLLALCDDGRNLCRALLLALLPRLSLA